MRCNGGVLLVCMIALGIFIGACTEKKPQSLANDSVVPNEYIFAVSYDKAWQGTLQAISETESRIITAERESGLVVTEDKTVNKLLRTLVEGSMFGRVYKNSYTVHLGEVSPGHTRISVGSNLILEEFAVYRHELDNETIKAYMRQELFRKICINLDGDAKKCTTHFPDYHMVSISCPTVPSEPSAEQLTLSPQVELQPMVISVKRVQSALIKAGYEPGPVDGLMGKKTRAAINRFQKDKGVNGSGDINWATMKALGF
jgi:hypothetical protein